MWSEDLKVALFMIAASTAFAGCAQVEQVLNPQTEEQRLAQDIESWASGKSEELSEAFDDGYPIYTPNGQVYLSEEELDEYKEVIEQFEESFRSHLRETESMEELREMYDGARADVARAERTIGFIESMISDAAEDFEKESLEGRHLARVRYCGLPDVKLPDCEEGTGYAVLRDRFYSDRPDIEGYIEFTEEAKSVFTEAKDFARDRGLRVESEQYLDRARNHGCESVRGFSFRGEAAQQLSMAIKGSAQPNEELVYDLFPFRVLQSVEGGILAEYRGAVVFVETDETFVDNYRFGRRDRMVCMTGTMQYTAVTGATRTVHAFRMIHDEHEYQFIPWE